MRTYLRMTKWT